MCRLVRPIETYNLNQLANQLENADAQHSELAYRIRKQNGDTGWQHMVRYTGVEVSAGDCAKAVRRLRTVLDLWAEECEAALDESALAAADGRISYASDPEAPEILSNIQAAPRRVKLMGGYGAAHEVVYAILPAP